jgi:hypothetical protein
MSKRFKSSKKRFAQIPGGVGRAMELRTHQNDMSEISNQIEQLRKDNYFLDQAIKTINGIIVLAGATSVLKPGLDKLKIWLTSTNLYIKKLEQFQKVIDTNKTLSKLANPSMLKNTGVLKTEIPKLSFAMKALNVVFIVTSLNEIKKNLDEIKKLESSKGNKDGFESNKDKIDNLNSKNYFEIIRLVNSVASFIPGAFAITTAIDAVLMVFNPDNLENLGYSLDGFKGGKEEAKRVWENATKAVNSASIKDFISYVKAFDPVIASVTDPVVKKILTKTIVTLRLTPEDEFKRADPFARFDSFNKFAQQVSKYNTPQEYKQYINWVDKPGNAAIVQEAILIFKTYKNTKRRIALEQTNEILSKMRSTKNPKELEKLSIELDKINMER